MSYAFHNKHNNIVIGTNNKHRSHLESIYSSHNSPGTYLSHEKTLE